MESRSAPPVTCGRSLKSGARRPRRFARETVHLAASPECEVQPGATLSHRASQVKPADVRGIAAGGHRRPRPRSGQAAQHPRNAQSASSPPPDPSSDRRGLMPPAPGPSAFIRGRTPCAWVSPSRSPLPRLRRLPGGWADRSRRQTTEVRRRDGCRRRSIRRGRCPRRMAGGRESSASAPVRRRRVYPRRRLSSLEPVLEGTGCASTLNGERVTGARAWPTRAGDRSIRHARLGGSLVA
jgi:hypothetical protein